MAKTIEQKIAQYLIDCAIEQRTTNYLEIAQTFDLPTEWPQLGATLTPILFNIFDWCAENRMPRLTALVVRRSGDDEGIPGRGFWTACNMDGLSRAERRTATGIFISETYDYFKIEARH